MMQAKMILEVRGVGVYALDDAARRWAAIDAAEGMRLVGVGQLEV
jgi:hypothetical protein